MAMAELYRPQKGKVEPCGQRWALEQTLVTSNLCLRCRVVICGAGIIGAATAYYLSQMGVAATVVEREAVACAASGSTEPLCHAH